MPNLRPKTIVHNLNTQFKANKWEEDASSLPPPWLLRPHQCLLHPGHFNLVDTSERMSNFYLFVNRFSVLRQCLVSFPKTLSLGVGTWPTTATSSGCWTWSPGILGALHQQQSETSVLRNCHWSSWWPNSRAIWKSFRFHPIIALENCNVCHWTYLSGHSWKCHLGWIHVSPPFCW